MVILSIKKYIIHGNSARSHVTVYDYDQKRDIHTYVYIYD